MNRTKLILDCDPGHDDAIAILLAGREPSIELLGLTVASGNQTIDKTTVNALNVAQYLELSVPVYRGCEGPMVRNRPPIADDIHGRTGLDGPVFAPLARSAETARAVDYLIDTLMASAGDVTLAITGPMTNVAMALRLEPRIAPKIREIVFMGGSYGLGNVTPAAEFNIITDAEAAYVVTSCGRPITMVGLDVTRKALCYPQIVERMEKIGSRAAKLFCELMRFFNRSQKEVFGWEGGPLHDPVTIAYLIDRSVLTVKPMHLSVDIRGAESYGRTNCDFFGYQKKSPNASVAVDIDVEKFWDIIEKGIRNYG